MSNDEAESRGGARPQKQELQPPGPAGEPGISPFPLYLLLRDIQLATEDTVLPVCATSKCQPEFSVFVPIVTVPEKYLYYGKHFKGTI